MSYIGYALRTAKDFYDQKTYDHALRVAGYVADNDNIPDDKKDRAITLAIMHDLLEDTAYDMKDFPLTEISTYIKTCLELLTMENDDTYLRYIKRIADNKLCCPEAYWVKLADMKDHLMQRETLTDKLKEKYLEALPYLL